VRLGGMGTTLYELLGPWLGWLSLLLTALFAARPAPKTGSTLRNTDSSV